MTPDERLKALKSMTFGKRINKLESMVANSFPTKKLKYVGDHSFWIHLPRHGPKNPDFIAPPFSRRKKVLEVFGDYWHAADEESALIAEYAEVGVECLVIWECGLLTDPTAQFNRIAAYLK